MTLIWFLEVHLLYSKYQLHCTPTSVFVSVLSVFSCLPC